MEKQSQLRKAIIEREPSVDKYGFPGYQNFTVNFYMGNGVTYVWLDNDWNKLEKLYQYVKAKKLTGQCVRIIQCLGLFAFGHPVEDKFIFALEGFECKEYTYREFVKFIYDTFGK